MATDTRDVSAAKVKAGMLFLLMLLALCVLAGIGSAHPARPVALLGEDVSFLVRLALVLIGWGLSWWAGKLIYKFLLNAWVPVAEATGSGITFAFFLALVFLLVAGTGELHWGLAILLVVLLIGFSMSVLWQLVGGVMVVVMLIIGLAAFCAGHFLA